jgi:hypothetical protein
MKGLKTHSAASPPFSHLFFILSKAAPRSIASISNLKALPSLMTLPAGNLPRAARLKIVFAGFAKYSPVSLEEYQRRFVTDSSSRKGLQREHQENAKFLTANEHLVVPS